MLRTLQGGGACVWGGVGEETEGRAQGNMDSNVTEKHKNQTKATSIANDMFANVGCNFFCCKKLRIGPDLL